MNIQDVDKNFLQNTAFNEEDTRLYDITQAPFALYGVFFNGEAKEFQRMPADIAAKVSDGVGYLNKHTAGGRVRFATDSTAFTLVVEYYAFEGMAHMALTGNCGFALCENVDGEEIFYKSFAPQWVEKTGFVRRVELPKGMREYTLYFPLYNGVKGVWIGLDKGAKIEKGKAYEKVAPILYYGSSITQGGCASRADTCYQGFICKRNNVDFINLGFSGNAKAEPQMMDYLASIDCSVFVYDYDHNAPTEEYLEETHYKGYKRYRAKQPTVPVLFVSRPDRPLLEEIARRAEIIKKSYEKAKAEGDKNVYFIDGRTLFEKEWQNCTVDGCHPTDFGFYQMSLKIGAKIDEILKNKEKNNKL